MEKKQKINILTGNLAGINIKFDLIINNINSRCTKSLREDLFPLIKKITLNLKNGAIFVLNFTNSELDKTHNIFDSVEMLTKEFDTLYDIDQVFFKLPSANIPVADYQLSGQIIQSVVFKYCESTEQLLHYHYFNSNTHLSNFIKGDTHGDYVDGVLDRFVDIENKSFTVLDLSYDKGVIAKTCLIRGINCVSFETDKKKIQSFENLKTDMEAQLNLFETI